MRVANKFDSVTNENSAHPDGTETQMELGYHIAY